MSRYLGIFLIVVAFIGELFFRHYRGEIIAYPFLWRIGFIIVGLIGVGLIAFPSLSGLSKKEVAYQDFLQEMKSNARKIELDIDKCEIKSGSYTQQVDDPEISTLHLLLPRTVSMYMMESTKTERIVQSYLIYIEEIAAERRRYISHPFPVDETTLKYYIITKEVNLYVDRFDGRKYLFGA
ncbi:MAG: hypothetical protein QM726_15170 [Chitinophagaceae bacterium]